MRVLCQIYKSSRKEEMYLYVEKDRGLVDVPAPLMERFGDPIKVMLILLTPERKLARANVQDVLAGIEEAGFYLQMPPTAAELLRRDGSRE